jgi:hypothetical protein
MYHGTAWFLYGTLDTQEKKLAETPYRIAKLHHERVSRRGIAHVIPIRREHRACHASLRSASRLTAAETLPRVRGEQRSG